MKLPPNSSFESLRWLLNLDLSNCNRFGELRFIELAEHYDNDEPWRSITAPNYRSQAILLCLQNELRGEALKRWAAEVKRSRAQTEADRGRVNKLKDEWENEILQGAGIADYERCWRAWETGDEPAKQKAKAAIERRRAAWQANREQEREAEKRAWQADSMKRIKLNAEAKRNRATGFVASVNWFAPMPIFNHPAQNAAAPLGYCQATGQNRKKVQSFLRRKKQEPTDQVERTGTGRPLDLYGFKSNLLVLDEWLGDWLLNSPHGLQKDSPNPERVCVEIARSLSCAIGCEYEGIDPDAKQFRAVLWKHWQRWWSKVTDDDVRAQLKGIETAIAPDAQAWRRYRKEARARREENRAKVRAGYFMKNGLWVLAERHGPMPYADVKTALRRLQGLPL